MRELSHLHHRDRARCDRHPAWRPYRRTVGGRAGYVVLCTAAGSDDDDDERVLDDAGYDDCCVDGVAVSMPGYLFVSCRGEHGDSAADYVDCYGGVCG